MSLMNNSYRKDEVQNINYYEESSGSSESSDSSESYYKQDTTILHCKNIDPALAKIMGIIIEEQKEIDWKPPLKSGLDNSKEIISSNYLKNKNIIDDIDYFKVIKDDILNYKTLTKEQLKYIKNLTNPEKFELIEIYNTILDNEIKYLK